MNFAGGTVRGWDRTGKTRVITLEAGLVGGVEIISGYAGSSTASWETGWLCYYLVYIFIKSKNYRWWALTGVYPC